MKKESLQSKSEVTIVGEYVLKDKDGNILPIFQENCLGRFTLKHFGKCPQVFPFGFWGKSKTVFSKI